MDIINAKPSELIAVVDIINPASVNAATVGTGWVDSSLYHKMVAFVQGGAISGGATVDAKLQQAQDNIGTGAKDITGKALTQITASNKQGLINLANDELDSEGGFHFVKLTITGGVAAVIVSGALLGVVAKWDAVTQAASTQVAG